MAGLFPQRLDLVSGYDLAVRGLHAVLVPRAAGLVDRLPRLAAARLGIGAQVLGVALAAAAMTTLDPAALDPRLFALLVLAALAASLGAAVMAIAVTQDWLPRLVPAASLSLANGRAKQIDLGTELLCPVLAGAVLAAAGEPKLGFALIAGWNLLSFVPEYLLIRSVPAAAEVPRPLPPGPALARGGLRLFFGQKAAPAMLAYTCLWVTVLSPHGVLLTAWLRTEAGLGDRAIGMYRGLGALFGLSVAFLYPTLRARLAVARTGAVFIALQALCLGGAALGLAAGGKVGILLFLGLVLVSRLGLYGFSLSLTEIEQTTIPAGERGRVVGTADGMNGLATLLVYGAGVLIGRTDRFSWLADGSVGFVALGALVFLSLVYAPRKIGV